MWGGEGASLLLSKLQPGAKLLDIGAGADGGGFGDLARSKGIEYFPIDFAKGQDWEAQNLSLPDAPFDAIYMCHSLEHMLNPIGALERIHCAIKLDGWIAVTVPPLKHQIVGGHLSLWNAGLLLYNMIIAGHNCRHAAVKTYDYNVTVVVPYDPILELPPLSRDIGDIERLAAFFPFEASQGFNGHIAEWHWHTNPDDRALPDKRKDCGCSD